MVSEGLPSGQGSLGEVLAAGLPGARPHRGAPGPHRPSTAASRPCPAPLQAPEDRWTAAQTLRPGPSATLPDTDLAPLANEEDKGHRAHVLSTVHYGEAMWSGHEAC